ncbi:hypothetical protein AAG587_08125 [Vreelandella neptunia]|uniref:hypothetical protein n=1 Tax=Vreelandella neptunia TaxID=115551 RepID=UPI00315A9615
MTDQKECLYESSPGVWKWCRIKFVGRKYVVLETKGGERSRRKCKLKTRPLLTARELWVTEAQKHCTEFGSKQLGHIYDAMLRGDLHKPEVPCKSPE